MSFLISGRPAFGPDQILGTPANVGWRSIFEQSTATVVYTAVNLSLRFDTGVGGVTVDSFAFFNQSGSIALLYSDDNISYAAAGSAFSSTNSGAQIIKLDAPVTARYWWLSHGLSGQLGYFWAGQLLDLTTALRPPFQSPEFAKNWQAQSYLNRNGAALGSVAIPFPSSTPLSLRLPLATARGEFSWVRDNLAQGGIQFVSFEEQAGLLQAATQVAPFTLGESNFIDWSTQIRWLS